MRTRLGMAVLVLGLVGLAWVPAAGGQAAPACPAGLAPGAAPTDAAGIENPDMGLECVCPDGGEVVGVAGPDGAWTPTPQDDGDCSTPLAAPAPEVASHDVAPSEVAPAVAAPPVPAPAPAPVAAGVLRRTG